jgi:hypothetical protein
MKAVKATYNDGQITWAEKPSAAGPVDVLVVFPEASDDPWEPILNDATPRPALANRIKEVEAEIAQGKASPLDVDQL